MEDDGAFAVNDYPHLITCPSAGAGALRSAIAHRAETGPFSPAEAETAERTILLTRGEGDTLRVWESHGGLTPPPSVLAERIRERCGPCSEENQLRPGDPGSDEVLETVHLRLDERKQAEAFATLATSLPELVREMFPRASKTGGLQMHCLRCWFEWPDEPHADAFDLRAQLWASLVVWADGGSSREQDVPLLRVPVLRRDGTFALNGWVKRVAVDDVARQAENLLRRDVFGWTSQKLGAVAPGGLESLELASLLGPPT